MKNIMVAGGGVLGSQIAFQTAYAGFNVVVWLRSEDSIRRTKLKLDNLKETYINAINDMANKEKWCPGIAACDTFNKDECLKKVEDAYNNIKLEISMQKCTENVDLVIESLAESLDTKINFFKILSSYLPDKTIIVTNSSTLLPSKMAKYTKRSAKFLSMHFANSIWKNNIVEVMAHSNTDMKIFNQIIEFAKEINMIPLPVKKEKAGYLLNSMLVPFLFSGLDLLVNGISDVESIDKAWTLGTGAPKGPFQILDTVGLKTAYNIVDMYVKIPSFLAPYNFKAMHKLLKEYIDEGKFGISSGEGFYKY